VTNGKTKTRSAKNRQFSIFSYGETVSTKSILHILKSAKNHLQQCRFPPIFHGVTSHRPLQISEKKKREKGKKK